MVELFESGYNGGGEFGYGESATGFGDSGEFAECGGGVVDVAEAVADGDGVECVVGEGEVHAVAVYFGDGLVFAGGEHALGEIADNDIFYLGVERKNSLGYEKRPSDKRA